MSDVIEVTQAMVEAGIEAINELRRVEMIANRREDAPVEISWADLLSAAYAGMERRRKLDAMYAELMRDVRAGGRS